jgi:hypothetical protein
MEKPPIMSQAPESLKVFAKLFLVVSVIFTVIMYFLSIALDPFLFYFTPEGLASSINNLPNLPVWLFTFSIKLPIILDVGTIFLGLWTIFSLCFIAAWKINENFHTIIKESTNRPVAKLFNSSLFALPLINSMTLIAVVILQSLQEIGGIPTGTSPITGNSFLSLLDLSHAAVFEEIGFRILPIGTFLIVYMFWTARKIATLSPAQKVKLFFVSILFPDKAKQMIGTKTVSEHGIKQGISKGEWAMLAFTSLVFGLAHFNPGVSWEMGKIASAGVAGLVIGSSYLVYGAHAAIIIHWFFNVYTDTFYLFSDLYPAAGPFANAVAIFSMILGIIGWTFVAVLGVIKLSEVFQRKEVSQTEATSSFSVSPQ